MERSKPKRMRQHDEIAVPLVVAVFKKHGFYDHVMGTEGDNQELRQSLAEQNDPTSLMLRFRPDRVVIKPGIASVLCEIKSESRGRPNFAIEARSYLTTRSWQQSGNKVMYALVDLSTKSQVIRACWCKDIPEPYNIQVPKRWDFKESMEWLHDKLPRCRLIEVTYNPSPMNSGTPFFLVAKNSRYLMSIESFIKSEIIDELSQNYLDF